VELAIFGTTMLVSDVTSPSLLPIGEQVVPKLRLLETFFLDVGKLDFMTE
jgi:hypothetical protein